MDHQYTTKFQTFIQPYLQDIENNSISNWPDETKIVFLQMCELVHNIVYVQRPQDPNKSEPYYIPVEKKPTIEIGTKPTARYVEYGINYLVGNFDTSPSSKFPYKNDFVTPARQRTLLIFWGIDRNLLRVKEVMNTYEDVSFFYIQKTDHVRSYPFTYNINMILPLLNIFVQIDRSNKNIEDIKEEFLIKKRSLEQQYRDELQARKKWNLNFEEFQKAALLGKMPKFGAHPVQNIWKNSQLLENIQRSGNRRPILFDVEHFN